jgi:phosphoserine phosphatase
MSAGRMLVVLDVDSTLTQHEGIDLLAESVSPAVADRVAVITARAMAGELDFAESLSQRVMELAGVTQHQLASASARVRLSVGAQTLVDSLHHAGHLVAAVSGGFHEMLDPLALDLGLDFHRANRFITKASVLTGDVEHPIVDAAAKEASLRGWAALNDIDMADTVAVGDGSNDIDMLRAAGIGIAYMAKPVLKEAADRVIDTPDLALVLDELGILRI